MGLDGCPDVEDTSCNTEVPLHCESLLVQRRFDDALHASSKALRGLDVLCCPVDQDEWRGKISLRESRNFVASRLASVYMQALYEMEIRSTDQGKKKDAALTDALHLIPKIYEKRLKTAIPAVR
jgi:hypothetical protein